jgi:hypothetical protein
MENRKWDDGGAFVLLKSTLGVLALVAIVSLPRTLGQQEQSAPVRVAASDSHEGVKIDVDPWTSPSRYKGKFPKKNPYTGGVVALELTFRNDNDEPIRLSRERIRLLVQIDEDNKQELQPLGADDVADAVLLQKKPKDPTLRRLPFPIPSSGGPKPARDKNWTELRDDCQNAALPSPVIGPHSTMVGLVYFDLRGEFDLLQNARVYVPDLERMTTKQAILYFDIGLGQGSSN